MTPPLLLSVFNSRMTRKMFEIFVLRFKTPPLHQTLNIHSPIPIQRGSLEYLEAGRMKGHTVLIRFLSIPDNVLSSDIARVMTRGRNRRPTHISTGHVVRQTA